MDDKLYRVTCRGMTSPSSGSGVTHGVAFVIANGAEAAYERLRKFLNEQNIGTDFDRALVKVELIAEQGEWPDSGMRLFI